MTWVDLVVVAILAVSALLAFMRGLVREVLGISSWIGAALVASWGLPAARPHAQAMLGSSAWVDPVTFGVIFLIALIVLMLISRWISRIVRASPLGGVDRTLGLVFGLARGAALVVLAYIVTGMVLPIDRWPDPVLHARALQPTYDGARWVWQQLPDRWRPQVYPPPAGRQTTAEALLHATPQGRATGKPPTRD
jgi:membrane protein required for colicin V production